MIFMFSKRTSYFGDEVFTFGISNSLGLPILVDLKDEDNLSSYDNTTYCGKWYEGEILKNYLVINSNEKFHFLAVIENKLWDNAPSNYELMVHFVCSFFPGKFSWAYPFCVNFVFYVGALILVFYISKNLIQETTKNNITPFLTMIFWGLSICGTGAFTFFRMYGVLSFYSLLLIFAFQKFINKEKTTITDYVLICFSFIMGLFTHTLFIVFAFWLTFFTCFFLLIKKRIIESIKSGLSVLISLIAFMIIYPFDYSKVFSWMNGKSNNGYGFITNLSVAYKYTFLQSIGIYLPITYANLVLWLGIFILLVFICMAISFLFRKEEWYKKYIDKIEKKAKKIHKYVCQSLHSLSPITILLALTSICYLCTTAAISPITSQGIYATRYLFLGMNPLAICFVCIFIGFLPKSKGIKKIISEFTVCILLCGLLFIQNHIYHNPFLFDYHDDYKELNELVNDSDVVAFASKRWILNSLIIPFQDVKSFYFDKISSENMYRFYIPHDDFYIVIDKSVFKPDDNSLLEYSNYVEGIGSTDDFAKCILEEKIDSYSIDFINTYYINRMPLDVYYVHIQT